MASAGSRRRKNRSDAIAGEVTGTEAAAAPPPAPRSRGGVRGGLPPAASPSPSSTDDRPRRASDRAMSPRRRRRRAAAAAPSVTSGDPGFAPRSSPGRGGDDGGRGRGRGRGGSGGGGGGSGGGGGGPCRSARVARYRAAAVAVVAAVVLPCRAAAAAVAATAGCSSAFFPSRQAPPRRPGGSPRPIGRCGGVLPPPPPTAAATAPRILRVAAAEAAAAGDDEFGLPPSSSSRPPPPPRRPGPDRRRRRRPPRRRRPVRRYLATCVPGLESVLARELLDLGASDVEASGNAAVAFSNSDGDDEGTATFDAGLMAVLWCRTAHRVMELVCATSHRRVRDGDDLYDFIRAKADAVSLLSDSDSDSYSGGDGDGDGGGGDGGDGGGPRRLLTLSVSAILNGRLPRDLCHSHYTALTVKCALVDELRDATGGRRRPDVELDDPDVPLVVALRGRDEMEADVSLYRCLHHGSLHRRGYRLNDKDIAAAASDGRGGRRGRGRRGGGGRGKALVHAAALKESLASGLLLLSGWDRLVRSARSSSSDDDGPAVLLDPMCGSATLLIEAALIAADVAPGLVRIRSCPEGDHGPHGKPPALRWGDGDSHATFAEWRDMLAEAAERAREGLKWVRSSGDVTILGNEAYPRAAELARANVAGVRMGLEEVVEIRTGDCGDWDLGGGGGGGGDGNGDGDGSGGDADGSGGGGDRVVVPGRTIIVANPPWGLRLDSERLSSSSSSSVDESWSALRDFLRRECDGAEAWILSGNKELTRHLRMRKTRGVPIRTADTDLRWIQYHVFGKGEAGGRFEEERRRRSSAGEGRGGGARERNDRVEAEVKEGGERIDVTDTDANAWY